MTTMKKPLRSSETTSRARTWLSVAMASGAFLLTLAAASWYLWSRYEDPEVRKVKELSAQLFAPDNELTPEDRQRLFGELREAGQSLTEQQRRQLWSERGNAMRNRMEQQINAYFELPEEKRVAYLDEQIERMEQMRRAFEQRVNSEGGGGGRGGPPGGRANGGPGGGARGGNRGETSEVSRRRRMLDNTTPEQRARWSKYWSDMTKRREQLGLPPLGRPGPPRRS